MFSNYNSIMLVSKLNTKVIPQPLKYKWSLQRIKALSQAFFGTASFWLLAENVRKADSMGHLVFFCLWSFMFLFLDASSRTVRFRASCMLYNSNLPCYIASLKRPVSISTTNKKKWMKNLHLQNPKPAVDSKEWKNIKHVQFSLLTGTFK